MKNYNFNNNLIFIFYYRASPENSTGRRSMVDSTAEGLELAISVRNACKSYGSLAVLRELNMDVPSGVM